MFVPPHDSMVFLYLDPQDHLSQSHPQSRASKGIVGAPLWVFCTPVHDIHTSLRHLARLPSFVQRLLDGPQLRRSRRSSLKTLLQPVREGFGHVWAAGKLEGGSLALEITASHHHLEDENSKRKN